MNIHFCIQLIKQKLRQCLYGCTSLKGPIARRAAEVQLMIFDIDGVFTEGNLVYGEHGEEKKIFNALDGHGIKLLHEAGLKTAIISGRSSNIVALRAADLGISFVYQGIENKEAAFETLCRTTQLSPEACGYMGDDWPDICVLKKVGFSAAPANAHIEVRKQTHWVTRTYGGAGAVREVCDYLLQARGAYKALLNNVQR